jgi:hypothetical protein
MAEQAGLRVHAENIAQVVARMGLDVQDKSVRQGVLRIESRGIRRIRESLIN